MTSTSELVSTIVDNMQPYRNDDDEYNISNTDTQKGTEILRDIVESSQRPKRPPSAYFLWLNDNRQNIKDTYFADYTSVQNWDLQSKKEYYEKKGLDWKDTIKEGKPKIVALVTSKAGILWKELPEDDKSEFDTQAKVLSDDYKLKMTKFKEIQNNIKSQTKTQNKSKAKAKSKSKKSETESNTSEAPKKQRGRPKKVPEEVNTVPDSMVEETQEENQVDVIEETVNGKTYYLDESSGALYDPETGDQIGEKQDDGTYTWF